MTTKAPTEVRATGADQAANVAWAKLSAEGSSASEVFIVYCDDGGGSSATVQAALDLSDECPSRTTLASGQVPSVNMKACGLAAESTATAHITGLANGQPYAFAVATRSADGQVSALSALTCAIPSANGEYELDGTQAGRNACSVSTVGAETSALAGVLLVAAVLFGRRRRTRSRMG